MIDWSLARRLAVAVSGEPPHPRLRNADSRAAATRSTDLVVAYTGLTPEHPLPQAEAVARPVWIEANLRSLRSMLEPLMARLDKNLAVGPAKPLVRAGIGVLLAAEAGAVFGVLSQRVLGQYDVAMLEPDAPARLLFVEPNLAEAAVKLGLDEGEMVAWVALHEVTHGVQFTGVPWLRPHLASLLTELLDSLDVTVSVDPRKLLRLPSLDDLRGLAETARGGDVMSAVTTPEQRELLDRMQAVMALLEGHAEHVMDAVGAELLPTLPAMRAAFDRRRQSQPLPMRVFFRLIGLDRKIRQYVIGKAFCDAVVAEVGIDGLNRAWEAPEAIPTLSELDDPASWIARTHVPAVTS